MIKHVDQLLDKWVNEYQDTMSKEKDEVVKKVKVSVKGFEDFAELVLNPDTANNVQEAIDAIEVLIENGDNTYENVRAAWYQHVNIDYTQIDHKEFSNIASRLRIVYEGLLRLKAEKYGAPRGETPDLFRSEDHEKARAGTIKKGRKVVDKNLKFDEMKLNDKSLNNAIEWIRRLYISAIALRNLPPLPEGTSGSYSDVLDAIEEFVTETTQDEWEIIKDKHIQVLEGKADMDIQIVSKSFNKKVKGGVEKEIGLDLWKIINERTTNFLPTLGNVDWGNLEGSRPLYSQVINQFIDIAKGKKPKPYINKYKNTKKSNAKGRKLPSTRASKKLMQKKKMNTPVRRGSFDRTSTRETKKQLSLRQIVQYINAALPKRLMQNMGRPALKWQSGEFGKSVKLKELHLKNNKLVGKYSYLLSPYQTFENAGRWPAGYNPKPLITNSIRELALRHTKQKIAYLWRE